MNNKREIFTFNEKQYYMGFSRYTNSQQLVIMLVGVHEEDPSIEVTTSYPDLYINVNKEAIITDKPYGLITFLNKIGFIDGEIKVVMGTPREDPDKGGELLTVVKLKKCPLDPYYECAYCKKGGSNMQRCSQCKLLYYCCKDHQIKDWREAHREECKEFVRDMNEPLGIGSCESD